MNTATENQTSTYLFALVLVLFLSFALSSCKKNPAKQGPDINEPFQSLNYDQDNFDGPSLVAGDYAAAAIFSSQQMASFVNGELTDIWYYIKEKPFTCRITVYESDANGNADTVLYTKSILGEISKESWNKHTLATPVIISGGELWLAIEFSTSAEQRTIGCDNGPAANNGDWLWTVDDNLWITYRQRTGESVNWNIRAAIKP